MSVKISLVAGARPNFIKIAPLMHAFKNSDFHPILIHTGQHYDVSMSDIFFQDLNIPKPDFNLGIKGGTSAQQIGSLIPALEENFIQTQPAAVLVVGDTNSSVGAAISAKHLRLPLIHVEAGIRSFDLDMPEEVNRLLTDSVTDYFFVTEPSAVKNLKAAGKTERVFYVGNNAIDSLVANQDKIKKTSTQYVPKSYALLTLHRLSNVEDPCHFSMVIDILNKVSTLIPIVFPLHPRTRSQLENCGLKLNPQITLLDPQGYLSFQKLLLDSKFVLTDSGGIQDESTFQQIPCLTLRPNTERPITCDIGTNTLVGNDQQLILAKIDEILSGRYKKGKIPDLWDGKASLRIVETLTKELL